MSPHSATESADRPFVEQFSNGESPYAKEFSNMATSLRTHALEVTRLAGSLGAQVRGLSLAAADPTDAETIQSLLTEHPVRGEKSLPNIKEHHPCPLEAK